MVIFETSGHRPLFEEPDRFSDFMTETVLAEAGDDALIFVIGLVVNGLLVGALGRLAIPGPLTMSLAMTIGVGIGASLLGGVLGGLLFNWQGGFVLAVVGAAIAVSVIGRHRPVAPAYRR